MTAALCRATILTIQQGSWRTPAEIENIPFLTLIPDADNAAVGIYLQDFPAACSAGFFGGFIMARSASRLKTRKVAESAIMIAASLILSEFAVVRFAFGGSVTLFSQVPLVFVSYRYGVKWGVAAGFVAAVAELLFGLQNFTYIKGISAFAICFFADYIIAFSALGLGGIFRGKIKNTAVCLALGGVLVSVIRFLCHYVSGVTIWKEYAGDMNVYLYSLVYNGGFMLPEMAVTVIGLVAISAVFDIDGTEICPRRRQK